MVKFLFLMFLALCAFSFLAVLSYIHAGRFDAAAFFLIMFNMFASGASEIYRQLKRQAEG